MGWCPDRLRYHIQVWAKVNYGANHTMEFELISYDRCPYVQRSVVTLLHKGVDHRITYIELRPKPDWFAALSPLGKVPILRVTDAGVETILFESAVINEFIDEVTPGQLMPNDPILRAQNRAWIEFGSTLFADSYKMSIATTASEFETIREEQVEHLQRVEGALGDGPYFNGAEFSLVDAAYAPFFIRTHFWKDTVSFFDEQQFPKVAAWSACLLAEPAVQKAASPELRKRILDYAREQAVYLGQLLAA